jgi:hypothetical protein
LTADPNQIDFTLEGCRNTGGITLPDGSGNFICPDAAYTTGNLGKGWNELDLVPHRVTLKNNNGLQTYAFVVAGDYTHAAGDAPGKVGWDVISTLTLNTAKSSGCTASITSGAQTITPSGSGAGGADQTIYRLITITNQTAGSTCVYDYYQRLALGSHNFSGSSLQSNLWNQNLTASGIGQKRLSIPVKEILPQELRKDMSASQGQGFNWTLTKSTSKANFKFDNTCANSAADQTTTLNVTVTWTKSDPLPNGDILITTHVYAKNPASRTITVTPTDKIYKGSTQTTLIDTDVGSPVDIPADTELLVLTHTLTIGAADANADTAYNDVATATYVDKVTNVPVPGTTQATASATVAASGSAANDSVKITDSESISGTGLSFKVGSPSVGAFVAPSEAGAGTAYTADTYTVGPVNWEYTTSSSGSISFSKTVKVAGATITSGSLADSAQIIGDGDVVLAGENGSVAASTSLSSDALVGLTINKSISQTFGTAQAFSFGVTGPDSYSNTVPISIAAGSTSNSASLTGLEPGSYTVSENTPPAGYNAPGADQTKDISPDGTAASCSASVSFENTWNPGHVKVIKTVQGAAPSGTQSFTFQLRSGSSTTQAGTILETKDANAGNGGIINFTTDLLPGTTYALCEQIAPGWLTNFPGSNLYVAYNPSGDNSVLCADFTVTTGELKTFTVDNTPPPGGRALTIGFWRNWASCAGSNGKQKPVLDNTLASFPIASGKSTHGVYIGNLYVDTCLKAVRILSKQDVVSGAQKSSDPAFNLAAQLLAAKLNVQAGAGTCPAAVTAITNGQAILDGTPPAYAVSFNGTGTYPKSGQFASNANSLATSLDKFNNDTLC